MNLKLTMSKQHRQLQDIYATLTGTSEATEVVAMRIPADGRNGK